MSRLGDQHNYATAVVLSISSTAILLSVTGKSKRLQAQENSLKILPVDAEVSSCPDVSMALPWPGSGTLRPDRSRMHPMI